LRFYEISKVLVERRIYGGSELPLGRKVQAEKA